MKAGIKLYGIFGPIVADIAMVSDIRSHHVVVVYHVTIVAIGHGLLKKFWPFFWY